MFRTGLRKSLCSKLEHGKAQADGARRAEGLEVSCRRLWEGIWSEWRHAEAPESSTREEADLELYGARLQESISDTRKDEGASEERT